MPEGGILHIELVYVHRSQDSCALVVVDQLVLDFDALDGLDRLLLEEFVVRRVLLVKLQIIHSEDSLEGIV